ncbi:MAG: DUF5005 domain-containing protein, partial [Verrucomicrobiota bacterium]|nr:DUF5005 domain-containing protein [Verrucomicrobiota bacterium]
MALLVVVTCGKNYSENLPTPEAAYKDKKFTELFRRTSGWVAGDGATSIPLSDGRVLWLFGDSHIDDLDSATGTIACLFQVRNAALLQNMNSLQFSRTLISDEPHGKSFFKHPTDHSLWFWPVSGFQDGNSVYVYLTSLRRSGSGNFGFEVVGHYFGKIKFPEIKIVEYLPLPEFNGIDFGCGFVKDTSSYTLAFGSKLNGTQSSVYVARFRTSQPESSWAYWDGLSWNTNVPKASRIGQGAAPSLSVCKVKSKFVLISSELSTRCDQGKEIYLSTSSSSNGPFSPRQKVFTVDDTVEGYHPFFYMPVGHPEFISAKNELLVTYSINGYEPCLPMCVKSRMNPDHYRPRAIRIPLKLIDPNF